MLALRTVTYCTENEETPIWAMAAAELPVRSTERTLEDQSLERVMGRGLWGDCAL